MPQVATTVAAFVERVEELTAVEISFEDHEFYAAGKLIASIGHDDDLTQPWVVMVNGESVHRENTWAKCYRYICTHYKDGSLPVQEQFYPASTTGNEVMVEIAAECEKYGFEILDDGIYSNDQKLGSISCIDRSPLLKGNERKVTGLWSRENGCFAARRYMLVLVDDTNVPLHVAPIQLTAWGHFKLNFDKQLLVFRKELETAYATAVGKRKETKTELWHSMG